MSGENFKEYLIQLLSFVSEEAEGLSKFHKSLKATELVKCRSLTKDLSGFLVNYLALSLEVTYPFFPSSRGTPTVSLTAVNWGSL